MIDLLIIMFFSAVAFGISGGYESAIGIVVIEAVAALVWYIIRAIKNRLQKKKESSSSPFDVYNVTDDPIDNTPRPRKNPQKRLKRKTIISAVVYIAATVCGIIAAQCKASLAPWVGDLLNFLCAGGALFAVCYFAKALHDPQTPEEARSLEIRDTFEKTGHRPTPPVDRRPTPAQPKPAQQESPCTTAAPQRYDFQADADKAPYLSVKARREDDDALLTKPIIADDLQDEAEKGCSMGVIAAAFLLPVPVFLSLSFYLSWFFLVGVIVFGLIGGLLLWIIIDSHRETAGQFRHVTTDAVIIRKRVCTGKQTGRYNTDEYTTTAQLLYFADDCYKVSDAVYADVHIGDTVLFANMRGTPTQTIAYLPKDWDLTELEKEITP